MTEPASPQNPPAVPPRPKEPRTVSGFGIALGLTLFASICRGWRGGVRPATLCAFPAALKPVPCSASQIAVFQGLDAPLAVVVGHGIPSQSSPAIKNQASGSFPFEDGAMHPFSL